MDFNFDKIINRRQSESLKWNRYEEYILPMWLADMDFECPGIIISELKKRIDHRIFGYSLEIDELKEVIAERLKSKFNFNVSPEAIIYFPGVVNNLCLTFRSILSPGDGVVVHTPAYPPFIKEPQKAGLICHDQELIHSEDGLYEVDFTGFDNSIRKNDKLFILCNPHNPIGKVYTRNELFRIADICLKHKLIICSDDIHCETVYSGNQYFPIASLDKDIADNTITMISPSKAFNLAALKLSIAIIPNAEIREKIIAIREQLHIGANLLGCIATLAAYRDCNPWLYALNKYLGGNRDVMQNYIEKEMPGVKMSKVESTFLAWLDCRGTGITGNLHEFFKKNAKVAVNDGVSFGKGGDGFIRLNFGCPRQRLIEALWRMKDAILATC
jgi:cystathionine beta-lyase